MPQRTWLRTVRADSGFFDGHFLEFLEARSLPSMVVARMTTTLKRSCVGIKPWMVIDEQHDGGEFMAKLFDWSGERWFVVVRECIREAEAAVGRRLIEVSG